MEFQLQLLEEVLLLVVDLELEIGVMEQHLIKVDQIQIALQMQDY